jgi:hypothetical protein
MSRNQAGSGPRVSPATMTLASSHSATTATCPGACPGVWNHERPGRT